MNDEELESIYDSMSIEYGQKLNTFYQLRSIFAPLIEGLILLDRLTFLLEQVTFRVRIVLEFHTIFLVRISLIYRYSTVRNRRRSWNVAARKFVKKYKCRPLNNCSPWKIQNVLQKPTKLFCQQLDYIRSPWKKIQNSIDVGPLIRPTFVLDCRVFAIEIWKLNQFLRNL